VGRLHDLDCLQCLNVFCLHVDLPTYLRTITKTVVESEYNATSNFAVHILTDSIGISFKESMYFLQAYYDAIVSRPLDVSSIPLLRSGWTGLNALQSSERANSLLLRKQHSCIMLTAYASWRWLNILIPKTVYGMLVGGNAASIGWLSTLIDRAKSFIKSGNLSATFDAELCGLDMPGVQCVVFLGAEGNIVLPNDTNGYNKCLVDVIVEVLGFWLGYPTHDNFKYQAYFVYVLVRDIGLDVLTLDVVWKSFYQVNKRSFHGLGTLTFDGNDTIELPDHPIFNQDSEMRQQIRDVALAVDDFVHGRLVNHTDMASSLPVDLLPPRLAAVMDKRLSRLKQFVSDCYQVVFTHAHISNDQLYQALLTRSDYYMPFREHGPTRIHMRGDDGPFSPSNVHTIEGVFSAIVGRGITFGSEFSRSGRTLFTSAVDFHKACDEMGEHESTFYCDPAAYGTHNSKKTVDLADTYWRDLQTYELPDFDRDNPLPFLECYRFFKPVKPPARFPELGTLAAYLLTADYVYADVVCPPTLAEMGYIIQHINKGAAQCLETIGFIPSRRSSQSKAKTKSSVQSCVDGFSRIWSVIADCILESEHSKVGLDYIMAENVLCKFERAISEKLISL
jgi:hypothetical protein